MDSSAFRTFRFASPRCFKAKEAIMLGVSGPDAFFLRLRELLPVRRNQMIGVLKMRWEQKIIIHCGHREL